MGTAIQEEEGLAEELSRNGKTIIKLNRGDPAAYFPTPSYIIEPYIKALQARKTSYSRAQGIPELQMAVSERYKRRYGINVNGDNVIVTSGLAEAISFINGAVVNAGEYAILFRPYYVQYLSALKTNGGLPVFADYQEKANWSVDVDALEKAIKLAKKRHACIKYLLITNPNNPTGTVLSRKTLEEIARVANKNNIFLISDEIYDEIVFGGASFTSLSQVAGGQPYAVLNGASKTFDATGFRLGYVIIPGRDRGSVDLRKKLVDYARVRLSANTPAEYAFAVALRNEREHSKAIKNMVSKIERIVDTAMKMLAKNPYLETVRPNSAFYIFPRIRLDLLDLRDDSEFVEKLLREKYVQTTRGSGFGAPSHFRIVALAPKDVTEEAIRRINDFCDAHAK